MHHFGEDMTHGWIDGDRFVVEAKHHVTGAVVRMEGPTKGVLTNPGGVVDAGLVGNLAAEFAHFLRVNLNGPGRAMAR
jgi:hypothetical protein